MIHNICIKLQNPMCNSSWEIFVTNFPMYYTGVRDRKKENEGKINLSSFVFCPTIKLATLKVYTKFEDSVSHRRWEICNRKFDWNKRKMDKRREIQQRVSKAHIPLAVAIRGKLKQFCRCNFLIFSNWRDRKMNKCILAACIWCTQ